MSIFTTNCYPNCFSWFSSTRVLGYTVHSACWINASCSDVESPLNSHTMYACLFYCSFLRLLNSYSSALFYENTFSNNVASSAKNSWLLLGDKYKCSSFWLFKWSNTFWNCWVSCDVETPVRMKTNKISS